MGEHKSISARSIHRAGRSVSSSIMRFMIVEKLARQPWARAGLETLHACKTFKAFALMARRSNGQKERCRDRYAVKLQGPAGSTTAAEVRAGTVWRVGVFLGAAIFISWRR